MTGEAPGDEFDIIARYFSTAKTTEDVITGIGDDGAVLQVPAGRQLVMTLDTLIEDIHFPAQTRAQDIAWKSIAVNLSDLAAMGAEAHWLMLSLSLPAPDTGWLQAFSQDFLQTCEDFGVSLIGGDTTRGKLAISVQATGSIEPGRAMRRDGARPGDLIMVTGTLGDAALALDRWQRGATVDGFLLQRLNRPEPRLEFGRQLAQYCRCCIDISDGLLADLGHILAASGCGALIELPRLPLSAAYRSCCRHDSSDDDLTKALTGGDDYELCFTINPERLQNVTSIAEKCGVNCVTIGKITADKGIRCIEQNAQLVEIPASGYKHF